MVNYILASDIHCDNTGSKPTFVVKNWSQILDITLVNTINIDSIEIWRVSDRVTFWDHRQKEFEIVTGTIS